MFTGIIQSVGTVESLEGENLIISGNSNKFLKHDLGTSISIDGVCLTLRGYVKESLNFQVSRESRERSVINQYIPGQRVNLELPLTMETFLSGHIVQGHVDTITTVSSIEEVSDDLWNYYFKNNNYKYLVDKGSITINGVSLTLVNPTDKQFSISIIRETYDRTNFNNLQVGTSVNIEFDIMAKYVERALNDK
jgi:riboflavin synthase|tara:strand:+ start:7786 stop:8364 length:579 start_codon:yes stop_codon:yes gene_type:complete